MFVNSSASLFVARSERKSTGRLGLDHHVATFLASKVDGVVGAQRGADVGRAGARRTERIRFPRPRATVAKPATHRLVTAEASTNICTLRMRKVAGSGVCVYASEAPEHRKR
jgi:hypothetical protein